MVVREKFSSQAAPELLTKMREVAHIEGRHFQSVLEDAMRMYIEDKNRQESGSEFMTHFYASLERNRLLGELLAKS